MTEEVHEARAACEGPDPSYYYDAIEAVIQEILIEYFCEHYAS